MEKYIFPHKKEITTLVNDWKNNSQIVGFIPTMGALHSGHLSLIENSINSCNRTVVSIFVNPTQFGPNEDLEKYPRQLEKDIELCRTAGVDAVFAPSVREMYGETGKDLYFKVIPPEFYTNKLCGINRQGHFDGVCQVIIKLLNIIPANKAFFGQKDAQQLFIVKKLVEFMDVPTEIVPCKTIREPDGLAMSSRNSYLDPESRKNADVLIKTLNFIHNSYLAGKTNFIKLSELAIKEYIVNKQNIQLEYLKAYNYENFKAVNELKANTLIAIAVKIAEVRLIDNIILK